MYKRQECHFKSSTLLNLSLYLLSTKGYTRYKDDFGDDQVSDDQRQLSGLFLVILLLEFFQTFYYLNLFSFY